jgi:hypothetical protein
LGEAGNCEGERKQKNYRLMKNLIKSLKIISALMIVWFLIHTTFIVVDGMSDQGRKADVALILGSKVNENGTLSHRLEKRWKKELSFMKVIV